MHTHLQHIATDTHAIILAAGLGTRLKDNTKDMPKCLVPVSGRPILARMLDKLQALGVRHVTVVVGYLGDTIRRFVGEWTRNCPDPLQVNFVENDRFAQTGSVFSLELGLQATDEGQGDQHLLLIEGDVIVGPGLLEELLEQGGADLPQAATLLAAYEPALNGTFATVRQGIVTAWLHETVRSRDFDLPTSFKTVNLTFVKRGLPRRQLLAHVSRVIIQSGQRAPLEYAMQDLVAAGMHIAAVTTRGRPWFEVDTPEDLEIANGMFAPLAEA
jgi:choline kinase